MTKSARVLLASLTSAAALMALPLASGAQTWTGALDGAKAVPASESQATGTVTLMLEGTTLVALMSWTDLYRFPGAVDLHTARPTGSQRHYAVMFPDFPATQSGSYSARIDLTVPSSYEPGFLHEHGDNVDAARTAIVAALNAGTGYVDVRSQQVTRTPEIGTSLVLRPARK